MLTHLNSTHPCGWNKESTLIQRTFNAKRATREFGTSCHFKIWQGSYSKYFPKQTGHFPRRRKEEEKKNNSENGLALFTKCKNTAANKFESTLIVWQKNLAGNLYTLYLSQVTDFDGFFEWVDVDLVPGLYQGDTTPVPMSFLIGGVRLRQLRVRHGKL